MSPTTAKWPAVSPRSSLFGTTLASLLAAAAVTASSPDASASGFLAARYGADFGNPVGPNAYSIYFNPAAITAAKGNQLTLDAVLVYRSASYNRPQSELSPSSTPDTTSPAYPDYVKSNTGKASLSNVLASPFLGFVSDLGGLPLHVGFAAYVPFGGQASWTRNDALKTSQAPGGSDGQQRWSTISGRVTSIYLTPAAAVAIPGTGLSIGVNGSVVLNTVETVRARNPDGSDDTATAQGRLVEGRSLVDVKNTTFAGAVGLYYEAIPNKLMVGASFTARPGFGQMRLRGTLKTQFGQSASDASNDVELLQTYPDVWRLGFGYKISDQVMIRVDGNFVNWSVFKRQCLVTDTGSHDAKCTLYQNGAEAGGKNVVIQSVKRNWKDAFGVRGSGSYYLSDVTELFGSVGYDSSAVPDSTLDGSFIDAPKLLFSAGVRQKFGKSFLLGVSYNHAYFFEVDTTGKNELNKLKEDSKQPSSGGVYNQQFFILDVNGTIFF